MRKVTGFTLIELMVVVAILAILAMIALPSYQQLIARTRISGATNELVGDLALARSEAAKRGAGVVVTICPSTTNGLACGTNWSSGRLVFVDGGTAGVVDGADAILRKVGAASDLTITVAGFTPSGYLSYLGNGSLSSTTQGTITVCASGRTGRVITISRVGRTVLSSTATTCS